MKNLIKEFLFRFSKFNKKSAFSGIFFNVLEDFFHKTPFYISSNSK